MTCQPVKFQSYYWSLSQQRGIYCWQIPVGKIYKLHNDESRNLNLKKSCTHIENFYTTSTEVLRSAGLFFCPLSALPDLTEKERIPCLSDYLLFDFKVRPGWIHYSPKEVTVLSCNEMFKAICRPVSGVAQIHNRTTVKVKTKSDYDHLVAMFKNPTILCVTRRDFSTVSTWTLLWFLILRIPE